MSTRRALGILVRCLAVLCLVGRAEAQLAKRGTYQAHFWWRQHGEWIEVASGHRFFAGKFTGTFFNDAGDGFLHRASAVCPGVRDVLEGSGTGHGYCVITDEDEDKATFVWQCRDLRDRLCDGVGEWIAGTGKYVGLKGRQTFDVVLRSTGEEGYAVFKGEWQLP